MNWKGSLLLDNEYIIMSEVSENNNVTQRELSKKLGVSVSTVNVLMNKMIREGLIKMTQVSQKQVFYMLTPVGMMEKAQKTVRYLKGHYRAIYETKEKIKSILDGLNQENDIIYVLMGNDEMSEILSIATHEYKSKNNKANIVVVQSIVDIDVKDYESPILLHVMLDIDIVDEDVMNEDMIKKHVDNSNLKIMNLVETL